jgi:hypothetical protein
MAAGEIGVFRNYPELVALLRRRKGELGLSDAALEALGGFSAGQVNKMLGPSTEKSMGRLTFPIVLDCLGLSGTLFVDPAKVAKRQERWAREGRRRSSCIREEHARPSKVMIKRARRQVLYELARRAALARWAATSRKERQAISAQLHLAKAFKKMPRARTHKAA